MLAGSSAGKTRQIMLRDGKLLPLEPAMPPAPPRLFQFRP
jgi:hypothetical protein